MPVKKNAKTLYKHVAPIVTVLKNRRSYDKAVDKSRGRLEIRKVHVFEPSGALIKYMPHVASVINVYRERHEKGEISRETVFYVSNLKLTARKFNKGIRNHWSIENSLHWVKDVIMWEDKRTTKNKSIAPVQSLIKSMITSIANVYSKSVISFQRAYAHDIESMSLLF